MDPYLVLGIDNNATREDIKLAYRRVAMKWHPDRNGNSAESRERFHQAAAAYRTLYERAAKDGSRDHDNDSSQYERSRKSRPSEEPGQSEQETRDRANHQQGDSRVETLSGCTCSIWMSSRCQTSGNIHG